jgi:hypothetical protein
VKEQITKLKDRILAVENKILEIREQNKLIELQKQQEMKLIEQQIQQQK